MVKVDLSGALGFMDNAGPDYGAAGQAHRALAEGKGAGADFTGWRELPRRVQGEELKQIMSAAERIRDTSEVLVVVGIGGSYLGARAGIELIKPKNGPEVIFAGTTLSPDDLNDKLELLGDREFSINVVSKSGTTLEPAAAFRIFRGILEKKYGAGARKRIYATTDRARGVLKTIADATACCPPWACCPWRRRDATCAPWWVRRRRPCISWTCAARITPPGSMPRPGTPSTPRARR